jgi:2-methylcitrate dehydratase
MDRIVKALSSYGASLQFDKIPNEVAHQAKRQLVDTLGCAMGGFASDTSKIARKIASEARCDRPATIIGTLQRTTPELAAFADGVMIRYLDFNDDYHGKEGGHPSDTFASILSCADSVHADGRQTLTAAVLAYEVFCRFNDAVSLRQKGFDHVVSSLIASTLGASKVLNLSQEQMAQAISLAVTPNIALVQTRYGDVSMWKNCAAANAARNAVFAARLAAEGITGPAPIFEGRGGFFNAVSTSFELAPFGGNAQPFRIMAANIKQFSAGGHSQTAIEAALKIKPLVTSVDDIEEVAIKTYERCFQSMAGDPEKWHPKTQQAADHSLPYVVSLALMYGGVEREYYSQQYLSNPQLLDLVQKVKVTVSEDCNKLLPDALANIMEVTTKSGQKFSERVLYSHGHHKNPMTDEEIERKFLSLSLGLFTPAQAKSVLEVVWNLEKLDDVSQLAELLVV